MLLWLQRNPWLSSILISLTALLVLGGLDLAVIGPLALFPAALFALSLVTSRLSVWLAVAGIVLGIVAIGLLDIRPGFASGMSLLSVLLVSCFDTRMRAGIVYGTALVSGIALVWFIVEGVGLQIFGFRAFSSYAQLVALLIGISLIVAGTSLAYLAGLWLQTMTTHVGSRFDRVVARAESAKLELQIAEQNKRFEIAKDISELVVQRLTAALTVAEAAGYAVKGQSGIVERSIEQVATSAAAAHRELRRLYDMLGKADAIHPAPPGIENLEELLILYRELGYNITLNHLGNRVALEDGQELAIYRIVFDALSNIRDHAPIDTDVAIDFIWVDNGLQVLIKDNGTELANRTAGITQIETSVEDDRRALTSVISGPTLTAMRERAGLYAGSVEFSSVPAVGFTVSAIFPKLFVR